jgi:hypothetical protein
LQALPNTRTSDYEEIAGLRDFLRRLHPAQGVLYRPLPAHWPSTACSTV